MILGMKSHEEVIRAQARWEALKEKKTIVEIALEFDVHRRQVRQGLKQILESLPVLFPACHPRKEKSWGEVLELYKKSSVAPASH